LRSGPGFGSGTGRSWYKWEAESAAERCSIDNFIDDHRDVIKINMTELLEDEWYAELFGARLGRAEGNCVFMFGYSHMNSFVKFDKNLKISVVQQPEDCSFNEGENSILFGIKTLPASSAFRKAIRETWLNPKIWKWLGYHIKVVFLIGNPEEIDLSEEVERHNDLLILDFEESHYNLPYKDIAFLRFIRNHCRADFIFKGDDDIVLIPQNLVTEIEHLKKTPGKQSFGCLKGPEAVMRHPYFKYFVPKQLYEPSIYPLYFSGAGYVTTLGFALKLEEQTAQMPVLPLDDTYIGSLIQAANMRFVLL